jgi:hypothetical protein
MVFLRTLSALLFAVILLVTCTGNRLTGTTDETVVTAHVYNPDHSPAANATVKAFTVNDTSRIPAFQTTTDNTGKYHLDVGNGMYNVLVGKDSLGAFQDSVIVKTTYSTLTDDTLGHPGVLCGVIVMQPMHNPQTATVQILGTDKYSNVLANGAFVIQGIPAGEYSLRSVTTLAEYTSTYTNITMAPLLKDTLRDTIELIYTGIPVVLNLKASYDTLAGIITLKWDTLSYFLLRDFLIYRDEGQILTPSTMPIGTSPTCTFTDTIGNGFSKSTAVYTYRVAVRSKDFSIGQTYTDIQVAVVPPFSVFLTRDTLPVYLGVPHTIVAFVSGSAGSAVVNYQWDIGGKGVFSASQRPETTFVLHDSIMQNLVCVLKTTIITIGNARTILDTVNPPVYLQWEKVADGFDTANVLNCHVVALAGKIVAFVNKDIWPFDSTGNKLSIWQSTNGQNWTRITDSLRIPYSASTSKPVVFQNQICLIDDSACIWTSLDGNSWNKVSTAPLCNTIETGGFARGGTLCAPALFADGSTLVLQPFPGTGSANILTSANLTNWDSSGSYQMRSFVSDYTELNGAFAITGVKWGYPEELWFGIKTASGITYAGTPGTPASGIINYGTSPYAFNLVTYKNTILYSNCYDNNLWALEKGLTPVWFPCSNIQQGYFFSLIVFNNEFYMISNAGVYKAKN